MGFSQFTNTIGKIYLAEHVGFAPALWRHCGWQLRRLRNRFPVHLKLSQSVLQSDGPLGVAAMVNCLGMYDYNNMTLVQRSLRGLQTGLLDVGANIGAYTLVASETGQPVVAVEPHPVARRMLQGNVERNQREPLVTLVATAVSDHEGEVLFSDGQSLEINHVVDENGTGEATITVPCQRLDQICRSLDCWPGVVKIDVEGHEPAVLAGFEEGLQKASLVIVEGGTRAEVAGPLVAAGLAGPFYYHARRSRFLREGQSLLEDPVFVRPEAAEQLDSPLPT